VAYLTTDQAEARLEDRFSITATVTEGDLDAASYALDASGPFIGERLDSTQELAFPRNLNPDGTLNTDEDAPSRILDWVALKAYQLSVNEDPLVTSESIGMASKTYATPKGSQTDRRMEALLSVYLDQGASTTTVGSSFDTYIYDEDYPYRWGLPLP
jgi:hypothetical protein